MSETTPQSTVLKRKANKDKADEPATAEATSEAAQQQASAPFKAVESNSAAISADGEAITVQVAPAVAPAVVSKGKGERPAAPVSAKAEPTTVSVGVSEELDFEALMAEGGGGVGRNDEPSFEPGDQVQGTVEVISLHGAEVFLDLGGKATGYILKDELSDADGNLFVKQGDVVTGVVTGITSSGIHIRTRLSAGAGVNTGDMEALREAKDAGLPVEGKVISSNKGGYEVQVAGVRCFCPFSQIDVYRLEDQESVVGKTMVFRVIELKGNTAVVSRAAILREEQAAMAADTLAKLAVGATFEGRVRSIQKFGAFVDLGGVDGLVHVSELSWDRTVDPHQVVKLGQTVTVKVLEIDQAKGRIALSMKQAQDDPWETTMGGISVGDTVNGTVVRLQDFGAFITIAPGVDGLLHVSDLAHQRIRHPKELLKVGDQISVKVMEIDLDRRRVGLSLKALMADPWDGLDQRFPVGDTVTGKIESVMDFGVFVTLEGGITALLPASESNNGGQPLGVTFRVGDSLEARVLRVDLENKKMALSRREGDLSQGGGRRGPGGGGGGGGGGRRDGFGGGRREGGGGRRDGRSGGGRREPMVYRDAVETKKDASGRSVGSLGEALMAALKKK